MTQAFNLSQFANKVNTSGQADLTTAVTGTLPVANGGTGAATLTSNNVVLGNGTSAVQFVAPSTNGNVLTSNGTTWTSAAPSSGGMTLLGTVTATSGNSLSLGSLNLTSYKSLYISAVGISSSAIDGVVYINANNGQVFGSTFSTSGISQTYLTYGVLELDLASGVFTAGVQVNVVNSSTYNGSRTDINTATTTIYFRLNSTQTFDAGSFIVYGVK
jgi:hypothetical protein